MAEIRIGGRQIPLFYSTYEMIEIEKSIGLGKLIRILGNAGLEENGEAPDLTDKWVLKNMKPGMVMVYAVAVMAVVNEGNQMEMKKEDGGPVDETLEIEQGKK